MANIDTYLQQIKTGVYGKDVRNAIHDAIKAVNQSIPTSTNVAQEVISARTPGDQGLPPYDNLKQRLDSESESLIEYADEKARPGVRAEIQITNAIIGYSSLKDRLDSNYNSLYSKIGQVDAAISAAEEAVEAADIATSKASEATNAANTAATKATEASNAASTASSNAQIATNRASQASTNASDAAYSANEAVTAAQQAQQAAQRLVIDDTLTQQGQAADAKKVGDELTDLKGDLITVVDDGNGNLTFIKGQGPEQSIEIDTTKLLIGGLVVFTPYYNSTATNRLCYRYFDIYLAPGTYIIHWDSTIELNAGIIVYNERAIANVNNNQTIVTSDSIVVGWVSNDYEFEIPEQINNNPVSYVRFNWKTVPTESTFSSANVISKLKITKVG